MEQAPVCIKELYKKHQESYENIMSKTGITILDEPIYPEGGTFGGK